MLHRVNKLDYLYNWKIEVSNVCNVVEDHCLQTIKIVHHYASDYLDWLISWQHSVNPSREAISIRILSGKYKLFRFVHPVGNSVNDLAERNVVEVCWVL